MGVRFHKSIKLAPGVKFNIGKKSVGVSIGNKYGGASYNTRAGVTARASAPGTGLSYRTKIKVESSQAVPTVPIKREISLKVYLLLTIFLGAFGVHRFYGGQIGMGILYLFTGGLFGIGWLVDIFKVVYTYININ